MKKRIDTAPKGTRPPPRRRRRLLLFLALLALGPAPAFCEGIPRPEERLLANGLRVVAWPLATEGIVTCLTVVQAGSRQDGGTGIARLTAAVLASGSAAPAARQRALLAMGAVTDFWVEDESSSFMVTLPPRALEKFLALEAGRFHSPVFDGPSVRAQAAVLATLQKSRAGLPAEAGLAALRSAAFSKHPYAKPSEGLPFPAGQELDWTGSVIDFHRRYYRPDTATLILAGDLGGTDVLALAERSWGVWGGRAEPPPAVEAFAPAGTPRPFWKTGVAPGQPAVAAVGWRTPPFSGEGTEFAALALAAEFLFGEGSEFAQETSRQGWGMILAVECSPRREPFFLGAVLVASAPDQAGVWRAAAKAAASSLGFRAPGAEPMERARRRLLARFWDPGKNPEGVARGLGRLIPHLGSAAAARAFLDTLARIDPAAVQAAAARWLHEGGLVEAEIQPPLAAPEGPPP